MNKIFTYLLIFLTFAGTMQAEEAPKRSMINSVKSFIQDNAPLKLGVILCFGAFANFYISNINAAAKQAKKKANDDLNQQQENMHSHIRSQELLEIERTLAQNAAAFKAELEIGDNPTCFDILGIAHNATIEDINRAYRRKAHRFHSDRSNNAQIFEIIKNARDLALKFANNPMAYAMNIQQRGSAQAQHNAQPRANMQRSLDMLSDIQNLLSSMSNSDNQVIVK